MGDAAEQLVSESISGDNLLQLLESLRLAGFSIGLQEYLHSQTLAEECKDHDGLIDPVKLRQWAGMSSRYRGTVLKNLHFYYHSVNHSH